MTVMSADRVAAAPAGRDGGNGMSFTRQLRRTFTDDWDAAVGHRFVRELRAGTVPDAVLARHLVQDSQRVDGLVALVGQAVASAGTPLARLRFVHRLGVLADDGDDYLPRALDRLGVDAGEVAAPALAAPTVGLRTLMNEARGTGSYPHVLAVLLVAGWLHLDWARLVDEDPGDWLHRGSIERHRGPEHEEWVAFLQHELDTVEGVRTSGVATVFGRAVELERAFLDAVYTD